MARAADAPFEESTEEHKETLRRNYVIKTPIARIERQQSKGKDRGVKKFTERQLLNRVNNYLKWCEGNDRVPSIMGLMLHLKTTRYVFYNYLDDPELGPILESFKAVIAEWVGNDIYRTPGQAAGKIAYAKNIHGWAEKIDQTSVNENRNTTVLSVEDARAKIASLAHLIDPKLLETLSGGYIRNQIGHDTISVDAEVIGE
jgi:hypothetical protein